MTVGSDLRTATKPGRDLAEGDTIVFCGHGYRVTGFEPYTGSLLATLGEGTRIAHVEGHGPFMTIPPDGRVTVAA